MCSMSYLLYYSIVDSIFAGYYAGEGTFPLHDKTYFSACERISSNQFKVKRRNG